ncbi:MAG: hypothetical protein LAQ69_42055 [Acidobacteriia bacterium]|nr:hypothetical protein [Terriglobia bacterium]
MSSKNEIRLALHELGSLSERLRDEIIWIMRVEFEPIVRDAGMVLRIIPAIHSRGDLNIDFDSKSPPGKVCRTVLGEDGTGEVWVRAHREMRVCGNANPLTGKRDRRRLLTYTALLGRALANCAIHELGHFIADLYHTSQTQNYMQTWGPPVNKRTLRTQREFWGGHQSFNAEQRQRLVTQLKKREWSGDPISFH